jgi:oligosaccharide repeat unit polymerase
MYGIEDKILGIVSSLLMLLVALGVRSFAGTLLIPAGIFSVAWFLFTFIPLVFLFNVPINAWAIFYIFLSVLFFAISSSFFNWRAAIVINKNKSLENAGFDSKFLKINIYFSAIASVLLSLLTMIINGFSVNQIIFNFLATSGDFAASRGSADVVYGSIGTLSIMFTYLSPVLGGLRIFAPNSRWFFAVSMSPSLFTMVTQSSKLVFLISLFLYLAGATIAKIYNNKLKFIKIWYFFKIFVIAALLAPLVLISFVSRLGVIDLNDLNSVSELLLFQIRSYLFAQIYAFSDFFSYTMGFPAQLAFDDDYYSFGAYTFASVFDAVGLGKDFPPGMFVQSVRYENVIETNIYTFYRGLIYDFGVIGSLVFIFFFGLFSHAITYKIFLTSRAWFSLAIFVSIVVFILLGYLVSAFVARYLFLNAALIWLLLSINSKKVKKRIIPSTHVQKHQKNLSPQI